MSTRGPARTPRSDSRSPGTSGARTGTGVVATSAATGRKGTRIRRIPFWMQYLPSQKPAAPPVPDYQTADHRSLTVTNTQVDLPPSTAQVEEMRNTTKEKNFGELTFGVGSCGHIMRRGPIMRSFGLSCVRPEYFLRKSTELHDMRTECQRILPKRKQFSAQFRGSTAG